MAIRVALSTQGVADHVMQPSERNGGVFPSGEDEQRADVLLWRAIRSFGRRLRDEDHGTQRSAIVIWRDGDGGRQKAGVRVLFTGSAKCRRADVCRNALGHDLYPLAAGPLQSVVKQFYQSHVG
jgi:hypothetical protein